MSFQHLIKVPDDRIGVLIGKNGRVKREIEDKCKVQIEIDSQNGDAVISSASATLSEMQPFKAIEIISAISRGFSPQRAYRLFDDEELMLQIIDLKDYTGKSANAMDRMKGRIIGQSGKSRKTIEELSGVYMSVSGHSVALIGKYEEVRLANDAVTMILKGSTHKTVYTMLQDARRKNKLEKMRLWEQDNINRG
ncbi:MAG: KH domain-containing protein [Thermoproteota archaeon]|nr:putative RNA-binding protein containing domain [Nitrososphaeraceae archaeon]MDQ3939441.1 KH domain-containing protein [Thermoproteota archaeon]MDQ3976442.1 KH domain-containing protein [Thermoproteota archaeon]HJR48064.1 KH domain-containing protein [Nitrososphaeraceae archaeon]HKI10356.1 KH domain-containing protein [Nitrososphaeraceae archaeon]